MAPWIVVVALAQQAPKPPPPSSPVFVERPDCGITFVHHRYTTPATKYLPEITGSGVGLLDYDHDGDLDVYCVQGCPLPGYPGPEAPAPDQLFRNDGHFHFTLVPDVVDALVLDEKGAPKLGADGKPLTTKKPLGLGDLRYGMAVTGPDVDDDGWADVFLTNVGHDVLYRNNRDGTFSDVTAESGIADEPWSSAACWADFDGDGDLDLYLANYAKLDLEHYKVCGPKGKVGYCHPDTLGPGKDAPDKLYRNDGKFHFTDVTRAAGVIEKFKGGKGLAAVPLDADGDGRIDVYVANDADPNFVWVNRCAGGGAPMKFEEQANELFLAVSGKGRSQSCMGTDVADVDGDLDFDVFSTNLGKEASILYVRGKDGLFEDRTYESGLGEPSYLSTGFGAKFFDYDRDADLDLLVVNGHVVDDVHDSDPSQTFEQVPHFYVNRGDGHFDQVGPKMGPFFTKPNLGRGLAIGDLDDDGDVDAVVLENDHPLVVLENTVANANHWIGFALTGTKSPRQPIGATVLLECAGKKQVQMITGSTSYMSWQDLRLFFGVGPQDPSKVTAKATIRWPSGRDQTLENLALDRCHAVVEPSDSPTPASNGAPASSK
jgi:hypothetical protein